MASMKQLDATMRERVGKGAARAVRRDNRVPAVIYGGGQAPVSISLDYNTTNKLIYAGHFLTTIFEIKVGGETIRAIPRDYQLDPVKDFPVHVDFMRLAQGSTIRVEVPVHFINQETCPGLKQGGALNIVRHSVEMIVPAEAIPDSLTADLAGLQFNEAVKIHSITLPAGTRTVIQGRDFTIATITPPKALTKEEKAAAEVAAAAAAAAAGKKK
ncbi:MAG: 50S ribosomal protein L25/general stress protein Ctc [Beijerinckiaceae bacterium]